MPHDEWALNLVLSCKLPFRTVSVVRHGSEVSWGLNPETPATEQELAVTFRPHSWKTSDRVHISFGWQSTVVDDPWLKADPPTNVFVALPPEAETGRLVSVCDVPADYVFVYVFALEYGDTEVQRMHRWRLRPRLAQDLPPELDGLASGRQTGSGRLSNDTPWSWPTATKPGDAYAEVVMKSNGSRVPVFVAREVRFERSGGVSVLGLAESPRDGGRCLIFSRAERFDDQDRALGMDTYSLTNEAAATVYGSLRAYYVSDEEHVLDLDLESEAAESLGLPEQLRVVLEVSVSARVELPTWLGIIVGSG